MKLVNTLIQATTPKGSHESDPFWTKAETALLQAIILMLFQEAPEYERNFSMVMRVLEFAEVKEEDEEFVSPLDLLFQAMEREHPESVALRQYRVFKQAEDIAMKTILVPMAAQVLTDKLPAYAPVADYAAILQVLTDAGVDWADVFSALAAHSGENIYYRTDHHWTSLGAYYAYCAWRGIEPVAGEWTQEVLCDDFRGTTWNKVSLPTVPAEEITAWYKHASRRVSYNNGQYEADSIYERRYLDGSDQYAVFLNSNQAQTVIEGSGKSGKLLLIKDSYGNTFAQFPVEDYAEVHVIDLRFFKGDVVEYAKENSITDTLVLYGTQNFVKDTNLRF